MLLAAIACDHIPVSLATAPQLPAGYQPVTVFEPPAACRALDVCFQDLAAKQTKAVPHRQLAPKQPSQHQLHPARQAAHHSQTPSAPKSNALHQTVASGAAPRFEIHSAALAGLILASCGVGVRPLPRMARPRDQIRQGKQVAVDRPQQQLEAVG